jgi:hypothetical protein
MRNRNSRAAFLVVVSGRLTIKAGRVQLREYNDPSWDVLQVLRVIPQKSRTFSKTFRFRGL